MKKVVIINGYPNSGKDSFVLECSKYLPVDNFSRANLAVTILEQLGWEGNKTDEVRILLSNLIHFLDKTGDQNTENIKSKVESSEKDLIFIHAREPEQIEHLKRKLEGNLINTIFIDSPRSNKGVNNLADKEVNNYKYDYNFYIKDWEHLKEIVPLFIDSIKP